MDARERLDVVSALSRVDEAFIPEIDPEIGFDARFLDHHRIDQVVHAGDATPHWYRTAIARGIMHRVPYRAGISTSGIIDRNRRRSF